MAERLPFGQIQPAARPVGSFIQPGRVDTQEAASPRAMPEPKSIESLRTAGVPDVNTKNQMTQLAEALGPFFETSSKLAEVFIKKRATDQIESGYYAAMANQQQKASLVLQQQKEIGAEKAAAFVTQLEKVDQVGADLLRNTNSFRAVGARRALAQLAAADVDDELANDLSQNSSQLAGIAPGSALLTQRRYEAASRVYKRYGLTGEETESSFYVTPALNKAWDSYAEKHFTLYNEGLKATTLAQGTAVLGAKLTELGSNGVNGYDLANQLRSAGYDAAGIPAGVVPVGDPQFGNLAGLALTLELDKQVKMLGGKDKADAIKQMREQLSAYGNLPGLAEALSFIRGGSSTEVVRDLNGRDVEIPVDLNKRPTWGASNTLDLLELQNRGNGARVQQYELGQKSVGQQLDALWWEKGMPGSMLPTDPGYTASLLQFRNQAGAMGYRDVDGYMKGRMDSQESVVSQAYAPDPLASQDFLNTIGDLPPSVFSSPEGIQRVREQARQAARAEPTRELQAARYKEYNDAIEAKQKQAEEFTPGVKQDIDRALLQDLGMPAVKGLIDKAKGKSGGGGGLFQSLIQSGTDPASAAASALGGSAVSAFTNRLQNLYVRNVENAITEWREKNPGRALTPAAKNVLTSQAIAETRKSKEYAQAYTDLTGKKPGEVGEGKVGSTVGPREAGPAEAPYGYPKRSAASIPDREVRAYQQRAVMNGSWVRSEVEAISAGRPVSAETFALAKRAGTSTNRLLLEQLRLYPELDANGNARKFLEEQVRRQRAGQTVSRANYQGAVGQQRAAAPYNPLAPGSWLMNMLMPPAAAATMPPSYARYGGGGGGPVDPGQWASGPAVAASHPEAGSGYTIPGAKDANGRPLILGQGAANSFAAMVRDSGGRVRAADVASGKRSHSKNSAVGGVPGSEHLDGNAMDIHGTSIAWIRQHGAKYGWYVNDYPGSHGGHVEFRGGGSARPQASTRRGGGMTGLATYYTGSGGSDGVAGGPTANGEKYNPSAMTAAVQWSLRGKYLNKWVQVEDMDTGKRVRVWVNDVGQMGGTERSVNREDPRLIDLSPAAFKKLFGSTSRGVGRIRIVEG